MAADVFTSFYEDLILEVPGCTKPVMLQHLKKTLRTFCRKSRVWRGEIVVSTPSTEVLTLSAPANATIQRIYEVYVSFDDGTNWNLIKNNRYTFEPYTSELTIPLYEDTDVTSFQFKIIAVYTPLRAMDNEDPCPEWILDRYCDGIAAGTKASLMMTPGTRFTNPSVAAYHANLFNKAIARAVREDTLRFSTTSNKLRAR